MPSALNRDALHFELPTNCVSANVVVDLDLIQYPGIYGTGFFARRNREVFYFTALHCLRARPGESPPRFSTLMVPYRHTGKTNSPEDFIQVDTAFTIVGFGSDDYVDLIGCPVKVARRPRDFNHLVARCAKLPVSAAWLDDYVTSEQGRCAIESGQNSAYVIGHPKASPRNAIEYAEEGGESVVSTEAVVLNGKVTQSDLPGHLSLHCDPSPYGFPGFSGAPVFAPVETPTGRRFTLLGMVVCGSTHKLNFLTVGRLLKAITGEA